MPECCLCSGTGCRDREAVDDGFCSISSSGKLDVVHTSCMQCMKKASLSCIEQNVVCLRKAETEHKEFSYRAGYSLQLDSYMNGNAVDLLIILRDKGAEAAATTIAERNLSQCFVVASSLCLQTSTCPCCVAMEAPRVTYSFSHAPSMLLKESHERSFARMHDSGVDGNKMVVCVEVILLEQVCALSYSTCSEASHTSIRAY